MSFEFEVLEVERDVVLSDVDLADRHPSVGGHRLPGRDIRLVVECRDDDLVAGPERRADRAPDVEGERRHVVAELDLVRARGTEEVGNGRVGLVRDRVAQLTRGERAAAVGVGVREVVADGVDDALRDLRAAGSVEKCDRATGLLPGEGREFGAQGIDIEGGHRDSVQLAGWTVGSWGSNRLTRRYSP